MATGPALLLLKSRARENPGQCVVPFVTGRFENLIGLLIGLRKGKLECPGCCERRGILDGRAVDDQIRSCAREALHEVQIVTRSLKIRLRREVRRVDDEGVAVPTAD